MRYPLHLCRVEVHGVRSVSPRVVSSETFRNISPSVAQRWLRSSTRGPMCTVPRSSLSCTDFKLRVRQVFHDHFVESPICNGRRLSLVSPTYNKSVRSHTEPQTSLFFYVKSAISSPISLSAHAECATVICKHDALLEDTADYFYSVHWQYVCPTSQNRETSR